MHHNIHGPEKLLDGLNDRQQQAVQHEAGPLLILAGPGSGKTRVICHRIAWLIQQGVVQADRILAVTFTNKAAGEMRERLADLVGQSEPLLRLGTYHALCARILRVDGHHIDVPDHFVIYDRDDQLRAAKLTIKALNLDDKMTTPRALMARISTWKGESQTPAEMLTMANNHRETILAKAYTKYEQILREARALDFDDLLLNGVALIAGHEKVRQKYADRFRYILVDEYQDTNISQYMLTKSLGEDHRNVCVVGDPDQSIYGWRGAKVENIDLFQEDFKEATVIRLERNYRSSRTIVDSAATLIENNGDRPEKRMWTERQDGTPIEIITTRTDLDEADAILGIIRRTQNKPKEAAVLYRMNAQSRTIEDALRRGEILYHIVGNIRFYERKEIKDTLAYLKVISNPDDDISLRRIINVPPRQIGDKTVEKLANVNAESEMYSPLLAGIGSNITPRSLWKKIGYAIENRVLTGKPLLRVRHFYNLIQQMRDNVMDGSVGTGVMEIIDRSGYTAALRAEKTEEANERLANLMELVSAAHEYEADADRPSLREFVDRQSLLSEADEGDGPSEAQVWLMTLHAAKGLEFPTVIMAGVEEGLLPHSRSLNSNADLREERRLCYVGMTRAMNRLVLTSAETRRRYGKYERNTPSRFLAELPG